MPDTTPLTVTCEEAAANLSALLDRARAGEEVVITQEGKPAVRLGPAAETEQRVTFGLAKGRIRYKGDFDAPLPDEILDAFEGKA